MARARVALTNLVARDVRGRPVPVGLPASRVRSSLLRTLGETPLCATATVARGRRAHVNTAFFCFSRELELFFLSHPRSRHCRNLAANSSMAIAVFASAQAWTRPGRGVQLFGTCSPAEGTDLARGERLYGKRFEAYSRWKAELGREAAGAEYRFYRFVPDRAKLLDESVFGDAVFVSARLVRTRRMDR